MHGIGPFRDGSSNQVPILIPSAFDTPLMVKTQVNHDLPDLKGVKSSIDDHASASAMQAMHGSGHKYVRDNSSDAAHDAKSSIDDHASASAMMQAEEHDYVKENALDVAS
jgi:hypothetical protein